MYDNAAIDWDGNLFKLGEEELCRCLIHGCFSWFPLNLTNAFAAHL